MASHRSFPAAWVGRRMRVGVRWAAAIVAASSLQGVLAQPAPAASTGAPSACPAGVAAGTRCVLGRDSAGAYYWLAMPPSWNGTLVVHAHGGPELGPPKAERAAEDLKRWSIWTRAGFAYAGSGYRQGGVAVTSAAEDTERVRRIFIAEFGAPG